MCHTNSMVVEELHMNSRKEKVTVSVSPELLRAVDSYVSDNDSLSRSAVFEEALQLWTSTFMDKFDANYYKNQAHELNDPAWSRITTEAAKRIWNSQEGE
jgi:hypothetical protein